MNRIAKILNAEVLGVMVDDRYCLRVEMTDRTTAFLFALGIQARYVSPAQDSGRAWLEFEYTPSVGNIIQDLVDSIGAIVYAEPNFGQMLLFDAEANNG